ncbi:hypothetical protein Tco_1023629, partial [Tanacetum coccineum]
TNPKQVTNNAKLEKMLSSLKDIVAPNKRRGLNKYLNFVNTAYENTLAILEDESSGKNQSQVTNNENLKKEVIIIDSSDDEVDLVAPNKSCRFKKEFIVVNKNDVSIMPCDDENTLPNIEDQSSGKNPKEVRNNEKFKKDVFINDISDDEVNKFSDIEDSDEEEGNIQNYIYPDTWNNINDNDEAGEAFVSDGDEDDSFINDGSIDYDTTNDEDSDDFF